MMTMMMCKSSFLLSIIYRKTTIIIHCTHNPQEIEMKRPKVYIKYITNMKRQTKPIVNLCPECKMEDCGNQESCNMCQAEYDEVMQRVEYDRIRNPSRYLCRCDEFQGYCSKCECEHDEWIDNEILKLRLKR